MSKALTSFKVRESEVASAATLVGEMSTTPLSKPPVARLNTSVILPANRVHLQLVGDKTIRSKDVDDTVSPLFPMAPKICSLLLLPSKNWFC